MPRRQTIKSLRKEAIRGYSSPLGIVLLPLLISLGSLLFVGCSEVPKDITPTVRDGQSPILEVKVSPYSFSMYPQYKSETKSLLKLDIRDKQDRFVKRAHVYAYLLAKDGHSTKVPFVEDSNLEKYISELALKHHDDYVIHMHIEMADKSLFVPKFSFHCGDPIPEGINPDLPAQPEGREAK